MDVDFDKQVERALCEAIREGVKAKMTSGYNTPLNALVDAAITKHTPALRQLLEDAIATVSSTQEFRDQIKNAVHQNLAKTLVQRFGGEIEKQVNALKSDPTTRARITLAIEEIVKTSKS